jgi:hypothetical protein
MKKLLTISLVILLTMAFCSNLGLSISKAQGESGGNSRDVTPPDVYITEAQLHARLLKYVDGNFTNISGAFQNVSPEVQSIGWNGTNKWLVSARGRFWEYDSATLTNVAAVESAGSYPYYDVAWNGVYWLGGSLMGSAVEYDGVSTAIAYPLQPAGGADVMTTDWNATDEDWVLGVFGEGFYVHLISYPGTVGATTDLGMPAGINGGFAGDYRNGDNSYYLAGGANVTMDGNGNITSSQSQLYSYNGAAFVDQNSLIPDLNTRITAITGGTGYWLVGGEGNKPLYKVEESEGFSGTALNTPAELTSVKSIGWAGGDNWLIGGYYTDAAGTSVKLYSYNGVTFTDLTANMQNAIQSYISDINSISWNGAYWLIGGAGLYNVGPDNGGSVMSTDKSAKVAFTGDTVAHDSLVGIIETNTTNPDTSVKSVGSVYDFTCQDLVIDNSVTQFDKSVTINLSYDPTELGDSPENLLSIYYYDEVTGQWVPVSGGTIDTVNKTIAAEVNHFTKFGVFAVAELPQTGK